MRTQVTDQLAALADSLKHQSGLPVCFRLFQEPSNAISGGPRSALGRPYGEGGTLYDLLWFWTQLVDYTVYEIKWSSKAGGNGQRIIDSQEVGYNKS